MAFLDGLASLGCMAWSWLAFSLAALHYTPAMHSVGILSVFVPSFGLHSIPPNHYSVSVDIAKNSAYTTSHYPFTPFLPIIPRSSTSSPWPAPPRVQRAPTLLHTRTTNPPPNAPLQFSPTPSTSPFHARPLSQHPLQPLIPLPHQALIILPRETNPTKCIPTRAIALTAPPTAPINITIPRIALPAPHLATPNMVLPPLTNASITATVVARRDSADVASLYTFGVERVFAQQRETHGA